MKVQNSSAVLGLLGNADSEMQFKLPEKTGRQFDVLSY